MGGPVAYNDVLCVVLEYIVCVIYVKMGLLGRY